MLDLPSQYLAANTFTDISENNITNRYIFDMMGEIVKDEKII